MIEIGKESCRITLIDQILLSYIMFIDHFDGVLRFIFITFLARQIHTARMEEECFSMDFTKNARTHNHRDWWFSGNGSLLLKATTEERLLMHPDPVVRVLPVVCSYRWASNYNCKKNTIDLKLLWQRFTREKIHLIWWTQRNVRVSACERTVGRCFPSSNGTKNRNKGSSFEFT